MTDDERLAGDWLRGRGYDVEFEPRIVATGRSPDFLATGISDAEPRLLWAEVKSIDPNDSLVALSDTWPVLKSRGVPPGLRGTATLGVTAGTRPQSINALLTMLHRVAGEYASDATCLIFIQQYPDKSSVRRVDVHANPMRHVWIRGPGNGRIPNPPGVIEDLRNWVTTHDPHGAKDRQRAFEVFNEMLPYDCVLTVHLDPSDHPLQSISAMSGGESSLAPRAISALEDANSQLRNGCSFRSAPGLVMIVPREDHADDFMIATAAYGELTVPVCLESRNLGQAHFGRNGVFRASKNTHISGAIRLRRDGSPATYFPNPFAKCPINERVSLLEGLIRPYSTK